LLRRFAQNNDIARKIGGDCFASLVIKIAIWRNSKTTKNPIPEIREGVFQVKQNKND